MSNVQMIGPQWGRRSAAGFLRSTSFRNLRQRAFRMLAWVLMDRPDRRLRRRRPILDPGERSRILRREGMGRTLR